MDKTVLVVDDSAALRKFVMFALRSQGYAVLTAQDGMEALEKMTEQQVDLVITDLNMPRMDGFGLVQAIRTDGSYASTPIIILSSLSRQDEIQHGLQLGANTFLNKPFDQKRLQYEVAKFIH